MDSLVLSFPFLLFLHTTAGLIFVQQSLDYVVIAQYHNPIQPLRECLLQFLKTSVVKPQSHPSTWYPELSDAQLNYLPPLPLFTWNTHHNSAEGVLASLPSPF